MWKNAAGLYYFIFQMSMFDFGRYWIFETFAVVNPAQLSRGPRQSASGSPVALTRR
jgi:hypothetical protein